MTARPKLNGNQVKIKVVIPIPATTPRSKSTPPDVNPDKRFVDRRILSGTKRPGSISGFFPLSC
jgi:hypothetical protein